MESTAARIPERWVNPIRVGTALIVLSLIGMFFLAIPARFDELTQPCIPESCKPLEPTQSDIVALEELGLSVESYAIFHIGIEVVLVAVSLLLIGLLFWRASSLWIGIIAILAMITMATLVANVIYALFETAPGWYPLLAVASTVGGIGLILIFFVFPDGRFYPRWTRIPVIVLTPIWSIINAVLSMPASTEVSLVLLFIPQASLLILGFVTQVIRYRRYYDNLRQQQTRWLMVAAAAFFLGILSWGVLFESTLVPIGRARILTSFVGITFLLLVSVGMLPYALTIAILRYRLWDIDLIIRRTVMYSAITALLAGVYFGAVTLLQSGFVSITGQESPLAVVVSTLAIAALFNPLRVRVQDFLDRRFNRRRYNAEQTLETFAEAMHDEVDMDRLSAALVSVVEETMQPESVGLWLAQTETGE